MADAVLTAAPKTVAKSVDAAAPAHADAPSRTQGPEQPFSFFATALLPPNPASLPVNPPGNDHWTSSRSRLHSSLQPLLPLQSKLLVGSATDPLEAEADSIAERVLRGQPPPTSRSAAPAVRRKCDCEDSGKPCDSCNDENEGKLMRRSTAPHIAPTVAPPIVHQVLRSPGQPLDPATRAFFEPRFGADFSNVRVRFDSRANRSAAAIASRAYTVGNDIVFADGQYAPHSSSGRKLLAHELAHVLQQNASPTAGFEPRLRRQPEPGLSSREKQLACVVRLGGCPSSRDGGIPSVEEIQDYNQRCKADSHFEGIIFPTDQECRNPPREPLSTGEKILIGAFLLVGAAVVVVAAIAAAEVVIPVIITAAVDAAQAGLAFYLTNAIVVNEIGVFAAGLLLSCEGDVPGLLRALANDPLQAAQILAEVYILHTNIRIQNGPARRASVPVKILPADQQTDPHNIRFKTVGPPVFEEETPILNPPPKNANVTPDTQENTTTPSPKAASPSAGSSVDQALAAAENDLNTERASVAQKKQQTPAADWNKARAGATKRLYNLLEKRAVLARVKAFPGRTYLEQAEIVGVEANGQIKPTSAISATGKGRIADILEVDGSRGTLEDLKSPSTQIKSVKGGMSDPDIETQFRSSSEIEKQHKVEQDVLAEARKSGGKVVIDGRDPITGALVRFTLDPTSISSRVTDYTSFGNN